MGVKFTAEQRLCIDTRNSNVLVSAAAGSGKTAVLVQRIIEMISDEKNKVDVDNLLVVTFTKAAAAEMRERIQAAITKALEANPDNEHLKRQTTLLHNAQITTIDSFSLFVVRNHFNEIGLEPDMRVADEGEVKLIKNEVLAELLEDKFAQNSPEFVHCLESFCPDGREKKLEDYILKISNVAESFPWPTEWLMAHKNDHQVEDFLQRDYMVFLKNYILKDIEAIVGMYENVIALASEPDGPYMNMEIFQREYEAFKRALEIKDLYLLKDFLETIAFDRLSSAKNDAVDKVKRALAGKIRGDAKDECKKIVEDYLGLSLEDSKELVAKCAGAVNELIDLVLEFNSRFMEKKLEKKIMTFSDVEHYALNILIHRENGESRKSAVAKELMQNFKEVLIDEYQDSNLLQEYLLSAVSGEEDGVFNRFMVGDVKQSIYKFRMACPELFIEKYTTYLKEGEKIKIDLAKNFRSREEVINSVNDIFFRIMTKENGGVEYDQDAALNFQASFPDNVGCETELILVKQDRSEAEDEDGEYEDSENEGSGFAELTDEAFATLGKKEAEVVAIGNKIKDLKKNFMVTDKDTGILRPLKYSDVVILLRSTAGVEDIYKNELEKMGIPVYVQSRAGYFSAREVQNVLQFCRTIDNPTEDICLFGTLKSIFGGFSDEEIGKLRGLNRYCSLYKVFKDYADPQCQEEAIVNAREDKLVGKVTDFLTRLGRYRKMAVYMPTRELLGQIFKDYDYLDYVTALPAGSKRRANVEMLLSKATSFEATSYHGLFNFIKYIEQLEKYEVDYGEVDMLDEAADVVRLMTIHKSKGLEFPVTFVAGMAKKFNTMDIKSSVVIHQNLGVATDYVDYEKRTRSHTMRKTAVSLMMQGEMLAEELRVLYVALTRAKDKLIMVGSLKDPDLTLETNRLFDSNKLEYINFMKAKNYLDFIMPIIHKTSIKVTIEETEELEQGTVDDKLKISVSRVGLENADKECDREKLEQIKYNFTYQYPHSELVNLTTKTSVSELKHAAMEETDEEAANAFAQEEIVPYIPDFKMTEKIVSGTTRGSAVHRVMEILEFVRAFSQVIDSQEISYEQYKETLLKNSDQVKENLKAFLLEMKESKKLKAEYYDIINIRKIYNFLLSKVAYRMWQADLKGQLYREQPFVLAIPASRLNSENPSEENVLIQGIIDVFFIENDKIKLLDYKTDIIDSMEALFARYETQLDYYKEAIEKIMDREVDEKILYSFGLEAEGTK